METCVILQPAPFDETGPFYTLSVNCTTHFPIVADMISLLLQNCGAKFIHLLIYFLPQFHSGF